MLGIQGPTDLTLEYCCRLVKEYTALDCAQLFSILRRYGRMNYAKRSKLTSAMCRGQYAKKLPMEAAPTSSAALWSESKGGSGSRSGVFGS